MKRTQSGMTLIGFLIVGLWIGLWLLWQGVVLTSLFVRKVDQ